MLNAAWNICPVVIFQENFGPWNRRIMAVESCHVVLGSPGQEPFQSTSNTIFLPCRLLG